MANQKQTRNILYSKDIKKLVAQSSGYHKYEVEDIYDHLIAVITRELLTGSILKLKGLGHFYITIDEPVTWFSGALGREVHRSRKAKVRYNMDEDMKRSVSIEGELMNLLGKDKYGRKREKTTGVLHGANDPSESVRKDIQN